MHRLAITILAVAPVSALGCGGDKTDSASFEGTTSEEGSSDEVSRVTVVAYQLEGDEYVDRNADLTYEVGADCQIWSRTAQEHGNPPEPGHEGVHDHWNASKDSTYEDETFTWIEYGPFLTENEVADSCAAGSDPSDPKSVRTDEYTEFQPGLYLRIKSVE